MIPYEELVAALDRYVERNGGTPMSARAPASAGTPAPMPVREEYEPPSGDAFDEPHDPDMGHAAAGHHEDADSTHVGAGPGGAMPPPLQPVSEDHSNEIDIGDVLADDEEL